MWLSRKLSLSLQGGSAKAAVVVAYHTQLASSLGIRACHQLHPDHKISIVLNLTPAYPRSQSPEDLQAARIAELFQTRSFWIHLFWDNTQGNWLTFLKNTVYVQNHRGGIDYYQRK